MRLAHRATADAMLSACGGGGAAGARNRCGGFPPADAAAALPSVDAPRSVPPRVGGERHSPRGRIGGSHGQSLRSSRPFVETAGMRSSSNRRRAVNGSSPSILLLCGGEYSAPGGTVWKGDRQSPHFARCFDAHLWKPRHNAATGFLTDPPRASRKSQTVDVPDRGGRGTIQTPGLSRLELTASRSRNQHPPPRGGEKRLRARPLVEEPQTWRVCPRAGCHHRKRQGVRAAPPARDQGVAAVLVTQRLR